jgi:hypothetical protein
MDLARGAEHVVETTGSTQGDVADGALVQSGDALQALLLQQLLEALDLLVHLGRAEQQACLRALLPDVMTVGAALGGQVSARGLLGLGVDEVKLLLDRLALRAVAEPGEIEA